MTITIDTSRFSAMCGELAARCESPPDRALREEVGKVLSRAIELTPAASASKIKEHSQRARFSLQPATLYTPKRPQRRHLRRSRVLYQLIGHRYPDELWAKLTKARMADVKKRLGARGLAKQSWLRIGQLLGLSVSAPAYVQRAVATTGKVYNQDEKASIIRQSGEVTYQIENSQPTINAIDGGLILQQAVNGRVGYFLSNVHHDVFNDLANIAKKYPGVTVT